MNIKDQIKQIEKEQADLLKKKEGLEKKLAAVAKEEAKLQKLFDGSGYKTPRALVKALSLQYGINMASVAAAVSKPGGRKRTRVTAELRDQLKAELKGGASKNGTAKSHGISYAVVTNVLAGVYDHL